MSRNDRKHMVANTFFKLYTYVLVFNSCNDRRYSYFTRNTCNRCVERLKILFGASLEAGSAIVTTRWKAIFRIYLLFFSPKIVNFGQISDSKVNRALCPDIFQVRSWPDIPDVRFSFQPVWF